MVLELINNTISVQTQISKASCEKKAAQPKESFSKNSEPSLTKNEKKAISKIKGKLWRERFKSGFKGESSTGLNSIRDFGWQTATALGCLSIGAFVVGGLPIIATGLAIGSVALGVASPFINGLAEAGDKSMDKTYVKGVEMKLIV